MKYHIIKCRLQGSECQGKIKRNTSVKEGEGICHPCKIETQREYYRQYRLRGKMKADSPAE
jgi:hypothetical protein